LTEFQNPQNQPGLDKRVLVIFAATMLFLVLAQQFIMKPPPPNRSDIFSPTSPPNRNSLPWWPYCKTWLTALAAPANAARPNGTNSTSAPMTSRTVLRLFEAICSYTD